MAGLMRKYTSIRSILIFFAFLPGPFLISAQQNNYKTEDGRISFVSEAPLEVISASSQQMEGIIDTRALSFAFVVPIRTFEGFNNGLQQQHFYENYMETDKYPVATYSGKIIEQVDLQQPGTYHVRVKGQLQIHGVSKERILKAEVISTGSTLQIKAQLWVPLVDHKIEVPRIVYQKIAQEIQVTIEAILSRLDKP